MRNTKLQLMTKIGVLSAIAFIIMFVEFPIALLFPPYLKIDFSDVPAIIGTFALGPVAGILIELIKNILHFITKSETGGIGELANFICGASFVIVAGLIYRRNKSRKNAFVGLLAGTVAMSAAMSLVNYFLLMPLYMPTMPKDQVLALIYSAIFPFNIFKGILISVITMLIYKRLSPILHR